MKQLILHKVTENREKLTVLFDQAIVSGVNFLVGILLARLLGVESYGVFALAWMALLFASGIQQAVIFAPLYSLLAKQKESGKWLSNLLGLQLIFCALGFAVVMILSSVVIYLNPEWDLAGINLLLPVLLSVYLLNDFFRRVSFVKHQPQHVVKIDLLGYGLQPLFIAGLAAMDELSVSTALASILAAQVCSLLLAWKIQPISASLTSVNELVGEVWGYSRYLLGTSVLQWFSGNFFVLSAGTLLGPAAVGAVRMAQNIMGLLHVLFQAMENIVPVRAAERLHQEGFEAMTLYFRNTSLQAVWPTGLLIGLIAFFREPLIQWVYGAEYLPYANVLAAFCGIYLLVFVGTMARFIIRTIERNQLIFWGYVLTTVFSVTAAHAMIVQWGEMGVVLGIALTHVITLSLYFYNLKTTLKWNLKSST